MPEDPCQGGVGCECHKIPSLKGWTQHLWGAFQVLNNNNNNNNNKPLGLELPLWRLSCSFTRTDSRLDLAMKDKGIPHAVGVSSSPVRLVLQHEFQVIPGTGLVLLSDGDGAVVIASTAVARYNFKC